MAKRVTGSMTEEELRNVKRFYWADSSKVFAFDVVDGEFDVTAIGMPGLRFNAVLYLRSDHGQRYPFFSNYFWAFKHHLGLKNGQ